jgi:hypothetical protein
MQLFRPGRLILAMALAVMSSGALAQQEREWPNPLAEQTYPVFDIARPPFNPIGLRWGGFLILPTGSETAAYDDNIFASDTHVASDFLHRAAGFWRPFRGRCQYL